MYLGIALGIILFAILIAAIARTDPKNTKPASDTENMIGIVWVFALFFGVPSLCCYAQSLPPVETAKYQITIDYDQLLVDYVIFDTYELRDDNKIYIPSYYRQQKSWINYWEHINSPLTIVVPIINDEPDIGTRIKTDEGYIQVIYPERHGAYIEK